MSRNDQGECDWERRLIARLRTLHYAWRTEQTYRGWAWKFVRFLGARPLSGVSGAEVGEFLTHLAVVERVSASTQKQALNALVFFLRESEKKALGDFGEFERARRRMRVPVVLSRGECQRLFEAMEGTARVMAELMYGSGLRLMELLRLRVKDVDLERRQLVGALVGGGLIKGVGLLQSFGDADAAGAGEEAERQRENHDAQERKADRSPWDSGRELGESRENNRTSLLSRTPKPRQG